MKKIIYCSFLTVILINCRPAKKVERIESSISKKDTAQTIIEKETVDSFALVRNIIGNLNKQRIDFNTFSAKVKIDYEGKEGGDQATAYLRIQKDSIIWISLTGALGIEGYRVIVSQDSVKLLNKLKKTIQYRSIAYLQDIANVPFDYHALQDFIVGNPIYIDSNIISYKATPNELLVLMAGNIFKHLITLDNNDFKVTHSKLDDVDATRNRTCDITYENYEQADSINFSTKRKITVSEKAKLDINLDFKTFNFNKTQDYPFNIPKNYKRG